MPQFNPGEEKVALATFPVKPAGLECAAELWLASNGIKVATSGEIPFVATGADQAISLPITMPSIEGTFPVYLGVFSNGQYIKGFRAVEDVVIRAPVPANLLLNPGFEDGFEHWTRYCNEPGRFNWSPSWEIGPRTGLYSACASGNVSGRTIVATMTQAVPWRDEYRGKAFKVAVWRRCVSGTRHEGYFAVMIDDGKSVSQNEIYIGPNGWTEQAVTKVLSSYASKLQVTFQIKPHRDWMSPGLSVDDTILEQL